MSVGKYVLPEAACPELIEGIGGRRNACGRVTIILPLINKFHKKRQRLNFCL
jgi:hypothetical protein